MWAGACLTNDDVNALMMMYPDCNEQSHSVNVCHKVNHNIGEMRLGIYVLCPLLVSLFFILLISGAMPRRARANASATRGPRGPTADLCVLTNSLRRLFAGIASHYLNNELEEARLLVEAMENDQAELTELRKLKREKTKTKLTVKTAVGGKLEKQSSSGEALKAGLTSLATNGSKAAAAIANKRSSLQKGAAPAGKAGFGAVRAAVLMGGAPGAAAGSAAEPKEVQVVVHSSPSTAGLPVN